MKQECKKHGLTKHFKRNDGYYRCRKCTSESVAKRRRKVKQMLADHFGGKCVQCGYDKCIAALAFHHPDKNKDFGIGSKGLTYSYQTLLEEAEKCELLCLNCHAEKHYEC
jgi:hypothetical protein